MKCKYNKWGKRNLKNTNGNNKHGKNKPQITQNKQ